MSLPTPNLRLLARFVIVGIINTAFSYAIYAFLLCIGLSFARANLISLALGVLFSFKTQSALVFRNSDRTRIFRFAAVWAVIYVGNILLIARFIKLGFNPYVSGLLAIPFATIVAFIAQKYFVFAVLPLARTTKVGG